MWSTPAVWKQYNKMAVLHFFRVNSSLIHSILFLFVNLEVLSCFVKTLYTLFSANNCSKSWPFKNILEFWRFSLHWIAHFQKKRIPNVFSVFFVLFGWYRNLPWGYMRSSTNFGPDRFSRFDVYRIRTDRQTKYIYILDSIDGCSV